MIQLKHDLSAPRTRPRGALSSLFTTNRKHMKTPHTPTPAEEVPAYVDSAEIARRYSVTPRHITALAESGDIPALRVGSRWRFDPAAVHEAFTAPYRRRRSPSGS